jgi:hypothetical protein
MAKSGEVKQSLVNDQRLMGRPTPETGGGTPQNQGLSEFRPSAKEREVGWGVKKQEEAKQQPADSRWESYDRFFRSVPMRSAMFREHERLSRRRNVEGYQPIPQNPAEQRGQQPVEEAGKKQPEPEYPQEQIEEARKIWPDLTTEQIIWRLKYEDKRKDDEKHGRRRGFSF